MYVNPGLMDLLQVESPSMSKLMDFLHLKSPSISFTVIDGPFEQSLKCPVQSPQYGNRIYRPPSGLVKAPKGAQEVALSMAHQLIWRTTPTVQCIIVVCDLISPDRIRA